MDAQFDRVKGATWFESMRQQEVMVLGQGGIGSWTSLLLARAGCSLSLVDMDDYEEHNMTGQLVRGSDIGRSKVDSAADVVREFSPNTQVEAYHMRYGGEFTPFNRVTVCGFDNMQARKDAFRVWREGVANLPEEERKHCFFQDGRLLAEQLQIFNIAGDDEESMNKYQEEYLFDDAEVADAECTFKQTSHSAAMIASHMVGFFTNFLTNANSERPIRKVPFFYQYLIPINRVI